MSEQDKAFYLEEVYDAQIAPLMAKIIDICKEHELPMFATFLYMNDPDGDDGVCTTILLFKDRPIPEKMHELVRIVNPPRPSPFRMRVTGSDGSIEDTVVFP